MLMCPIHYHTDQLASLLYFLHICLMSGLIEVSLILKPFYIQFTEMITYHEVSEKLYTCEGMIRKINTMLAL